MEQTLTPKNQNTVNPAVRKARIYTMPEKFHAGEVAKSGGRNTFLIIAIAVVVLGIIGVAAFWFLNQESDQGNDNTNTPIVVGNDNLNVSSNANRNGNINANSSANANLPVNSKLNLNTDVNNTNLFPTNNNANTNSQTGNFNSNVAASQDTDLDGLTDIEEVLYNTSISISDTDKDNYTDGQELVSGYDPNGTGKLENSAKVKTYYETARGYSVFYPTAWAVADDPQNTQGKIFTSGEEFVLLDIQDNPANLSARDWYISKSPSVDLSRLTTVINWTKTLSGVKSADGLNVYYTMGNKVYILSYNINILSEANYKYTFEMMYKSFALFTPSNTNTNTNTNTNANINYNSNQNTNLNLNLNTNTNTNTNNTNSNSNQNSNRL